MPPASSRVGVSGSMAKPLPRGPQTRTVSPALSSAMRRVPRPTTWKKQIRWREVMWQMPKGRAQGISRPNDVGRTMTNWPGRHDGQSGRVRRRAKKRLSWPVWPKGTRSSTVSRQELGCVIAQV